MNNLRTTPLVSAAVPRPIGIRQQGAWRHRAPSRSAPLSFCRFHLHLSHSTCTVLGQTHTSRKTKGKIEVPEKSTFVARTAAS